jgi:hypothetical protein
MGGLVRSPRLLLGVTLVHLLLNPIVYFVFRPERTSVTAEGFHATRKASGLFEAIYMAGTVADLMSQLRFR